MLLVRAEDGAFRASFSPDSTLLDVRTWIDAARFASRHEAARPSAPRDSGGRVLVHNEQTESLRAGRENFERQTARMREEARAQREEARARNLGTGPQASGEGSGASPTSEATYFVVAGLPGEPRREFVTEESMRTTLRDAGLVPQGTLLIRKQKLPQEDGAQAEVAFASDGLSSNRDQSDTEAHDGEADEGVADQAGVGPSRGAGRVLGGDTSSGAEVSTSLDERRRAALAAFEARQQQHQAHERAHSFPDSPASPSAAQPAAGVASAPLVDPRRQAALQAALARCSAAAASSPAAPEPADAPSAEGRGDNTLQATCAITSPPSAPLPRPTSSAAAQAALAAAEARSAAAVPAVPAPIAGTRKAKESIAARAARAVPSNHGKCPATVAADVPSKVGVSAEARRERLEALRLQRLASEREKEAIRMRLAEDQRDRKIGAAAARLGTFAPETCSSSAVPELQVATTLHQALPIANAGGSSSAPGPVDTSCVTSEVRVRYEDGTVLRRIFGADAPLQLVADMVAETRPVEAGPFVLRVPYPRREYGTQAELAITLRGAGLAPRGTLLVLGENSRGVVRRAEDEEEESELVQQMVLLQQLLAGMPVSGPGDGALEGYEQLLEYSEHMGEAVAGLSMAQIARLPTRIVDDPPPDTPDAPRCCICCYGHAQGDKLLMLPCNHDFHLECILPWLRAKRFCPLCKATAAPAEAE